MKTVPISRRTVLRGAGGAVLALPALEIMDGPRLARADARPKRFVICHCGVSIGGCDMWRDGITRPKTEILPHDLVTPQKTGPAYEETVGLKSIFKEQVQSDMGLVSGLHIPMGELFPDYPPASTFGFHGFTHVCQYAGKTERPVGDDQSANPCGPSADQIIAPVISSPNQYMKTLPLVLEAFYNRGSGFGYEINYLSFVAGNPGGPKDKYGRPLAIAVQPYLNPSDVYNKLFDPMVPSTATPANMQAAEAWKRDKLSVLDAVRDQTGLLYKRLGKHDRLQMDRWLEHVKTLRNQKSQLDTSKCMAPPAADYTPARDPRFGGYYRSEFDPEAGYVHEVYDTDAGYGNETERARMQADLIAAAFACDRTRVVSWMMTGAQSNLNMYPIFGLRSEFHAVSHNGNGDPLRMAMVVDWHIAPLARLVKNLQQQVDVDGSRMIDNTIILMFFEGGWGHQVYNNRPNSPPDQVYEGGGRYAHSTENMVLVMAGGRNLGIQPGQHIHYDPGMINQPNSAQHPHPAQVVLTALRQLGYTGRFGDCPDSILPEMLRS